MSCNLSSQFNRAAVEGIQEFQKPVVWSKSLGHGAFVRLQLCECGFL